MSIAEIQRKADAEFEAEREASKDGLLMLKKQGRSNYFTTEIRRNPKVFKFKV